MPSTASSEKTRQALILAAQDCLASDQLGISVAKLTELAGVSVGSLYSHFKDRENLFEQAGAEYLAGFLPALNRILESAPNPAIGLVGALYHLTELPTIDPRAGRIVLNGGTRALNQMRYYSTEPSMAIRQAVLAGSMSALDAEAFVISVIGAFQMVITRQLSLHATPDLPLRVALQFGHQLGFDDAAMTAYLGTISSEELLNG
ncbi:MAG: HTH-type transcriptional regulator AcrR [Actinomycetota bacterium]|jgi:AcrR family transcriptional regulator